MSMLLVGFYKRLADCIALNTVSRTLALGYMHTEHTPLPFIRELLVHKSEKEIAEAEERFLALIDLAERVVARQKEEQESAS